MALVEKVESVLRHVFPRPDKIDLEDDNGIIGTVTSERFVGMERRARINLIWDALQRELTVDERRRVVLIVPATPFEEDAYTAIRVPPRA